VGKIVTVGHTGYLGSYLSDRFDTVIWPGRFNWSTSWWTWAGAKVDPDFVFYVARCCGKESPRRTPETLLLETQGIVKAIKAFPNAHFIYTSTKVVNGFTDDWVRTISLRDIGTHFEEAMSGMYQNETVHLPTLSDTAVNRFPAFTSLSYEHQLYAHAKEIGETLVRNCAKSHTIFRIWDIE
jgi:nucleoside-diphosphate-sugar epimerase